MIVVDIQLVSALGTGRNRDLGTMVIDNVTSMADHAEDPGRGDYRCRMYRAGARRRAESDWAMVRDAKPTREGRVLRHRRLAEPVQNLVAKALKELGYG